jgi:hypothetical protein
MNRRATVAIAVTATAVLTVTPALAKTKPKPKPKPLKGSWSFTDTTPDPSVDASSDNSNHCHGKVPAGPADVNAHTLTVTGRGLLTVSGATKGDWAMEVRDRRGNPIAGSDGSLPTAQEGTRVDLVKGTWTVFYCNVTGAPTATASYTFVYR